jgi:hypothetical protein
MYISGSRVDPEWIQSGSRVDPEWIQAQKTYIMDCTDEATYPADE